MRLEINYKKNKKEKNVKETCKNHKHMEAKQYAIKQPMNH